MHTITSPYKTNFIIPQMLKTIAEITNVIIAKSTNIENDIIIITPFIILRVIFAKRKQRALVRTPRLNV